MPHLQFKGRVLVENHHLSVPFHELIPVGEKGLNEGSSLHDNLVIHGDNLASLKSLLPIYRGKIHCVYIDPPYNTGNEGWAYSDSLNSPLIKDWLGKVVDRDDLTRHDKWLCMMMPRLKLLRELLREDGAIFVSIDDNEVHHLRCLMDDVFGCANFRNIITVRRGPKNLQSQFPDIDKLALGQEYILFYSKSSQTRYAKPYKFLDSPRSGSWNNHWRGTDRPTMRYELLGHTPTSGQWRWGKERSLRAVANYEQFYQDNGDKNPSQNEIDAWWLSRLPERTDLIRLSKTGKPEHYVPPSDKQLLNSLWKDMISNESNSAFGSLGIQFDNPKRVELIRRIITFVTSSDSIILDSFAGSGTTAHAVLAQNQEDGGKRHFILIECEDYADSTTAQRVRNVISGVPEARNESLRAGYGGTFSYFELGNAMKQESLLSGSHLPSWEKLASYVFFTATGQEFDPSVVDRNTCFIGRTKSYDVFLFYEPDMEKLKNLALSLSEARAFPSGSKRKLVFAPAKYLDREFLHEYSIDFQQLPFQIYESIEQGEK